MAMPTAPVVTTTKCMMSRTQRLLYRLCTSLFTRLVWVLAFIGVPLTGHADAILGGVSAIQVEVLSKSTHMWNGQPIPPYPEGTPELSVVRITIPPGMVLPLHEHPFATAGFLLQGHIEVRTPHGQLTELKAGEGLIELVNLPHAGANIGDIPAVIIVVYAGIAGEPVTRLLENTDDTGEPL